MGRNVAFVQKPKRPVGRPSSYRRVHCDQIIEAMAGGLSAEAAAAKIGISARSLFYWQREHDAFLHAIQERRQPCLLWWEERAIAMANGEPGNTQIVSLGLRNRSRAAHGWNNDPLKLEQSGHVGGPGADDPQANVISTKSLSREERAGLRAFLESHIVDVEGE